MEPDSLRSPGVVAPALGIVLIAAAVLVSRSPVFEMRELDLAGSQRLDRTAVLRLAGLRIGQSLNSFSTREVETRLLLDPRVKSARVTRDLPGTLRVRLSERRSVGLARAGGGRVVVADDGVSLGPAGPREPLPDLGAVSGRPRPGARVEVPTELLRVAASLPERLRRAVRGISVRGGEVTMTLRRGGLVRYGSAETMDQKNAAILSLIRYARREGSGVETIDVRSPSAPALRLAGD